MKPNEGRNSCPGLAWHRLTGSSFIVQEPKGSSNRKRYLLFVSNGLGQVTWLVFVTRVVSRVCIAPHATESLIVQLQRPQFIVKHEGEKDPSLTFTRNQNRTDLMAIPVNSNQAKDRKRMVIQSPATLVCYVLSHSQWQCPKEEYYKQKKCDLSLGLILL